MNPSFVRPDSRQGLTKDSIRRYRNPDFTGSEAKTTISARLLNNGQDQMARSINFVAMGRPRTITPLNVDRATRSFRNDGPAQCQISHRSKCGGAVDQIADCGWHGSPSVR